MKYKRVASLEEALELLKQGRKLTHSQGKWYLHDLTHHSEDWNAYLPAPVRNELQAKKPELFSTHAEISDALLKGHVGGEHDEQADKLRGLTEEKPESEPVTTPVPPAAPTPEPETGQDVTPNEYILHDTERNLMLSIITLENLHLVPEAERYEIPFANLIEDAKGNLIASDGGGDKMRTTTRRFSLMDMAVRRLVEYYHRYKKVAEEIAMLQYEKGMLFEAGQIQQEKIRGLEEVIFVSSLTRR